MATKTARGRSLNRVFPEGSSETISFNDAARIAESAGLPGITFAQVAQGESSLRPGAVGNDPGGTQGLGLWQITTGYNDDVIARFGGREQMFNPVVNARAAKVIYDRQGLGAWYGTSFVTDPNAHYDGALLPSGQLRSGASTPPGDPRPVAGSADLIGEEERSAALKALLWVAFVLAGAGLAGLGVVRMLGLRRSLSRVTS